VTSPSGTSGCVSLLRDVSRRLTHEVNNAANGVAVNLEVVRSRLGPETTNSIAPFAERAAAQLDELTDLQELLLSLIQLTIDSIDDDRLSCGLSSSGDAFEITFPGAVIARPLPAGRAERAPIRLRNSPHGVILSVPRNSPSSE